MSAAQQKTALRRRMKALAASLDPAYNAAASRRICRALTQQPAYQRAGTVFCFVGTAREIDTRPSWSRSCGTENACACLCAPVKA